MYGTNLNNNIQKKEKEEKQGIYIRMKKSRKVPSTVYSSIPSSRENKQGREKKTDARTLSIIVNERECMKEE